MGTPVFDKTLYIVKGITKKKPHLVGKDAVVKLFLKMGKKKRKQGPGGIAHFHKKFTNRIVKNSVFQQGPVKKKKQSPALLFTDHHAADVQGQDAEQQIYAGGPQREKGGRLTAHQQGTAVPYYCPSYFTGPGHFYAGHTGGGVFHFRKPRIGAKESAPRPISPAIQPFSRIISPLPARSEEHTSELQSPS
jgi:hypothetical protein